MDAHQFAQDMQMYLCGVTCGPILPVVPVICNQCANTILVSAVIAGLVKGEETSETPPKGARDES